MNNEYNYTEYQPLNQLVQLIILINSSPQKYNIISLSQKLNLPIGLTRNIIAEIANSQTLFQIYIGTEKFDNIKDKKYTYFEGLFDTYALSIKSNIIIVNQTELYQYNDILQSYITNTASKNGLITECIVKEDYQNVTHYSNMTNNILRRLQDAFLKRKTLLCKKMNGDAIYPIAIYHDVLTSKAFCITLSREMISFHPIDKLRASKEVDTIYSDDEISATMDLLNYVWSPHSISLYAKPALYRIIIKNEPNTIEKIRHDVSNYDANFTAQSNGCYLLELNIISTDNFISWLLSYGSSITVLEPLDAREKIINIYKNVIKKNS